jgi:cell division protein FtsL
MTTRATARTGAVRTTGTSRAVPRARTAPRPELRLVPGVAATRTRRRPVSLLRHRRAPFVLLVVALLVGTTLGLLVLNTAIAVDSLKATQLRTANADRAEELQRLQQQVVEGSTPEAVATAAAAAGMVPAGVAAHLVIAPDGSAVLRGTPEPAPAAGAAQGGN